MKPKFFVSAVNDPKPKKMLFESERLWAVAEVALPQDVKSAVARFIGLELVPLLSTKNQEVRILVESCDGKSLPELHRFWKDGKFPAETEFERSLGKFHKTHVQVEPTMKYLRMEITQIEKENGQGSWAEYEGEYTSVILDEDLNIIDPKSERAT